MAERVVTRAFIKDNENRVLIGLRTKERKWSLIGGKPNSDESPEDALLREVREELGRDLNNLVFYLNHTNNMNPEDPWTTYYFTGDITGEVTLQTEEILEVRYVGPNNIDNLDFAFDHKERLEDFFYNSNNVTGTSN